MEIPNREALSRILLNVWHVGISCCNETISALLLISATSFLCPMEIHSRRFYSTKQVEIAVIEWGKRSSLLEYDCRSHRKC